MNSADRVLAILTLFNHDERIWTAEAIARHFAVSVSQAYRYCKSLVDAGLLDPCSPGGYMLGPAFLEYERLMQMSDPLISAAHPVMIGLVDHAPPGATVLVSKLYHSRVMCMDQIASQGPQRAISFERGRPMPLLWGATSKAILAYMSPRDLARVYRMEGDATEKGLQKPALADLKAELAEIRRLGFCVARGEVDADRAAVAAPIFGDKGVVIGSLTTAVKIETAERRIVRRLASLMVVSAREIEDAMMDRLAFAEPVTAVRSLTIKPGESAALTDGVDVADAGSASHRRRAVFQRARAKAHR